MEVTPKPTHGRKKKAVTSRVLTRRARVLYRLSTRAKVNIAVHVSHRNGSHHVYRTTVERRKRRGSIRLRRLVGGHALGRGTYRVVVTAFDDSTEATSHPRRARFRVAPARHH